MRRLASTAFAALLLAAAISACADSNAVHEDPTPPPPVGDAGSDAAPPDASDANEASLASDRICTDDNWCHTELPPEHMLIDVWGDGQGILWAVSRQGAAGSGSEHGNILRWDGKSWTVHFPSESVFTTIRGRAPTDLWAGGVAGLLHGDGTTWSPVDLGEEGIEIHDIAGSDASGIWVVGRKASPTSSLARVFHRAPGSTIWERVQIAPIDAPESGFSNIRRIWIAESGDVWLGGYNDKDWKDSLFRLAAAPASSWSLVPLPAEVSGPSSYFSFTGVGAAGGNIWLFGYVPRLGSTYWVATSNSIDEATDWKLARWKHPLDGEDDSIPRYAVWGLAENDVWAAGAFARIQHWDGTAWTTMRLSLNGEPLADDVLSFWGRTNDDLWAVGGRNALHRVSKEEADRLDAEHARKDGGQ